MLSNVNIAAIYNSVTQDYGYIRLEIFCLDISLVSSLPPHKTHHVFCLSSRQFKMSFYWALKRYIARKLVRH